jgi:Tfp pilus assembly protein PilX
MLKQLLRSRKTPARQRGAALIIVVFFFIAVSLAIIQSATTGAIVELRTYRTLATSKFAYAAAEAGIEDVFYRTITEKIVPASETIALNNATSTVVSIAVSATQQDIYATGQAGSQVRKLYFSTSKNNSVPFLYGAQVGEGGVTMKNGSTIDGTGLTKGDLYSNGPIEAENTTEIDGNAISAAPMADDVYASSTSCTNDEVVGNVNPNIDYAESFQMTATTSAQLAKVALYIKRTGNVTGGTVRITADSGGHPATTALASQALSYSSVSTSYGWIYVPFSSPATLNPNTTYWIVFDATQNGTKYWTWCRSNSDTYATGSPMYKQDYSSGSGSWTAVSGDMTFRLTFGSGSSQIEGATISGIAKADSIENTDVGSDAYYQTLTGGSTVGGVSYPGSPTPPPVPLPISSSTIAQWKADALSGGVINGDCGTGGVAGCDTFPLTLGPRKINGNLQVDGGQSLKVSGTLHVTGTVEVSNNSNVQCDIGYDSNSCIIIADGSINVSSNGVLDGSGVEGSFIMLLTTIKNCYDGASGGSGCTSSNSGIDVGNNVSGALFYSTDSKVQISNNATVTAVVGYMLDLSNGTHVIYDSKIANLSFSPSATTTTGAWNTNRWNEF